MLEHGFTPQKMAQVLERVGYDGILSEMAEERYGGFFQGLLGLNERPSDEGFRGRVSAALEGLFPDRNQLITEAIGFAIPSIMHSSMHGMYAALGRGCVSDARADANGLNFHMSSRPTVSIGGLTASEVNAIRDLDDERRRLLDGEFGTAESNAAAIGSNAANALARRAEIAKGKLNADAADVEDEVQMRTWLQNKAAEIVSLSSTREELDANLLKYNAQTLFGTEGVRAIVAAAHRRGMVDADTEAFYAKGGKYDRLMEDAKKRLADAAKSGSTVDDAARDLTLQLESSAKDTSIVSDATERFSGDAGTVRVNGFSDDMAGDFAMRFARLGDLAWRYKTNLAPQAPGGAAA